MTRHIIYTADHHTQGLGHAYPMDTWFSRFRTPTARTWQTVESQTLTLHAETGTETEVNDPSAPTRSQRLAMLEALRLGTGSLAT